MDGARAEGSSGIRKPDSVGGAIGSSGSAQSAHEVVLVEVLVEATFRRVVDVAEEAVVVGRLGASEMRRDPPAEDVVLFEGHTGSALVADHMTAFVALQGGQVRTAAFLTAGVGTQSPATACHTELATEQRVGGGGAVSATHGQVSS
jgi:hypothetical protein